MDTSHRVRSIISFVQTATTGSFAAAARTLGVSAAAVSKNVAGLEKSLGIRLLNRTTRAIQLTEEGELFLRKARIAIDALNTAVDTVSASHGEPHGKVRISTSVAFGREQLMPLLPGLLSRYPGITVTVDFDDRVTDLVRDGYDIALRGGHVRDSALISRPVCRLNTVLVATPTYLSTHGVPSTIAEISGHRLIARRFLSGIVDTWSFLGCDGSIITLDPTDIATLILSAPEAVVEASLSGVGIAQVPVHLAWPQLISGRLKIVMHEQHHPGPYEMTIQYPHRALIASRVSAVVDYLLKSFSTNEAIHVPLESLKKYSAVQ